MPIRPDAEPPPPVIRRALVSVSDKTALSELGRFLKSRNVEILSTGGTARHLEENGVPVTEVSAYTDFPEMMDGRIKTLHPKVHGGILARRDNPGDVAAMEKAKIGPIDLLVVNLYPFEATLEAGGDFASCLENIDIGGPAMVRAAAKNHAYVTVLTRTADYGPVMEEMERLGGSTSLPLRRRLAADAFQHTAAYDSVIGSWLARETGEPLPRQFTVSGRRGDMLRYGENPHQKAAFYVGSEKRPGVASARQLQGKALSYNNLNDTDAAFELVCEFDDPAVAIIKHANPCGVAVAGTLAEAYRKAHACDPVSAFGGVVAVNRPLDGATATALAEIFTEVVIAPAVDQEARSILAGKSNLRVLETGAVADPAAEGLAFVSLAGGFLVQSRDSGRVSSSELKVVTRRRPSDEELQDMLFAFRVAKHVKSNAIVYAKEGATVAIGAAQMSRVDSARIAASKSEDARRAAGEDEPRTRGSAVASDAFFPFADGLLAAIEAGAASVIQPGGSMRDEEVIAAADEAGVAMVFTGMRHFRH